jgi:hypothetical protein
VVLFQPSDLAWWGWLLCAGVAEWLASQLWAYAGGDSKGPRGLAGLMAFVFWLAAVLCGFLAIIRIIKWVWKG